MEIEITFSCTFGYMWLAKIRHLFKRSIYLYGLGSICVASGLNNTRWSITNDFSLLQIWLAVFASVMLAVFAILLFGTFVQSKNQCFHAAIFSNDTVLVRGDQDAEFVDGLARFFLLASLSFRLGDRGRYPA